MANGTNISSGSAPLFLGSFNSNRAAMMQKMTDRMIEQADKERTQQSKERADMLKALSFDAVAGLGRKAQEAHLNELEGLQDKWSRKWIENGKKLTDRDYMELERDKVNMQQKVANMKHNVAQYGYHAKTLMEHPELYHPSTVAGMKQYYEGGDVGKDISEVVRYMPDTSSYLGKAYGNLRTTEGDERKGAYNPDQNAFATTYSNRRQIEGRLRAGLQNNEYYKSLINSGDPYVIKKANEDVESFINSIVTEKTGFRNATAADLKMMNTKSLPEDLQETATKYGWEGDSESVIRSKDLLNKTTKEILKQKKLTLDMLVGNYVAGFKVEEYRTNDDGSTLLLGKADKSGDRPKFLIPSIEGENQDNIRLIMNKVIEALPPSIGKITKPIGVDNQEIIRPDYEVDVKDEEKAPITAAIELQEVFDWKPGESLSLNKLNDAGNPIKDTKGNIIQEPAKAYDPKHRKQIVAYLSENYPNDEITTEGDRGWINRTVSGKKNVAPIRWVEEDGTVHNFSLLDEGDIKKIKALIQKKSGRKSQTTAPSAKPGILD